MKCLAALGVTDDVLSVYTETLSQGSLSNLANNKDIEMFDLFCRVAGATDAVRAYKGVREDLSKNVSQAILQGKALADYSSELVQAREKKERYDRLCQLRQTRMESEGAWMRNMMILALARRENAAREYEASMKALEKIREQIDGTIRKAEGVKDALLEITGQLDKLRQQRNQAGEQALYLSHQVGEAQAAKDRWQKVVKNPDPEMAAASLAELEQALTVNLREVNRLLDLKDRLENEQRQIREQIRVTENATDQRRLPDFVCAFSQALESRGIEHYILADILSVKDPTWQAPIESYLGSMRYWVMVPGGRVDYDAARRLVQDMRYSPGIRGPRPRLNHWPEEYKGTVWELLSLEPQQMEWWGQHLDGLGWQLYTQNVEQTRALERVRPEMCVFT